MTMRRWLLASLAVGLAGGINTAANAVALNISFENTGPTDGFVLTPLWASAHDGSFDLFDSGSPASAGLQLIAEEGDASTLITEFAGTEQIFPIGNAAGFGGAPVVESGET
ncbi:MAG: spondin domain-containing protein, partial [Gammaproteobacteria bacterium]|nr:spondin domain-containing protein [Gammaproteobacteria bacterium]